MDSLEVGAIRTSYNFEDGSERSSGRFRLENPLKRVEEISRIIRQSHVR